VDDIRVFLFEATRRLCEALPGVRVIGLSMHENAEMAAAMRGAGAVAYLCKDVASHTLIATILDQRVFLQ
jgi:DNA-binding NarL/FixJ family response regulator